MFFFSLNVIVLVYCVVLFYQYKDLRFIASSAFKFVNLIITLASSDIKPI